MMVRLTACGILGWFVLAQLQEEAAGVLHAPVRHVERVSHAEEQEAGAHLSPHRRHLGLGLGLHSFVHLDI